MEKADILNFTADEIEKLDLSYKNVNYDPYRGFDVAPDSVESVQFLEGSGSAFREAAVLSLYSRGEFGNKFGSEAVDALLSDSNYVEFDGQSWWTLDSDARRTVVAEFDDIAEMREILDAWPERPQDALQQLIDAAVYSGQSPTVESQSLEHLGVMLSFVDMFGSVFNNLPAQDKIRAEIDWYRLLQPFRDLAGDRFAGREDELNELGDYVGVLDASGFVEYLSAGVREVFNFHEKPPLMIHGAGGMGKSTLLAHFVLKHTQHLGRGSVPFIYIDFDRSGLTIERPLSLLSEALRQLAIQFPEASVAFSEVRRDWQRTMNEYRRETKATLQPGVKIGSVLSDAMRQRVVTEFASILSLYDLGDKPLLFLLDTFEEMQNRHPALVRNFWMFLQELQEAHPRLRVVLSGRTPIDEPLEKVARTDIEIKIKPVLLTGMDKHDCLDFFAQSGVPKTYAKQLVKRLVRDDDGASPLALRVAIELWNQALEEGQEPIEILNERFWIELRAGKVQEQLINRYLKHITNPLVRQIASPGFVLRKLTPKLILVVLSSPCGVNVTNLNEASDLFDRLRDEVSLVYASRPNEKVLIPRAETRLAILELLKDLEPARVEQIHENAVTFYTDLADSEEGTDDDRINELYHRLSLEQTVDEIAPRLPADPEVTAGLLALRNEFTGAARSTLDRLMGETLSAEQRRAAEAVEWERHALPKAKRLLEAEDHTGLNELLASSTERVDGSELYLIEVELLNRTGQASEAQALAEKGLRTFDETALSGTAMSLLIEGAKSCVSIGNIPLAQQWLERADGIAAQREDLPASLEIVFMQIDIKANLQEPTTLELERLDGIAHNIHDRAAQAALYSFTKAVSLLGWKKVWLIRKAIRIGALDGLGGKEFRDLTRVVGRLDADYSERINKPAGQIAAAIGLTPKSQSVTEMWRTALENPERRSVVLDRLLALVRTDQQSLSGDDLEDDDNTAILLLEQASPLLQKLISLLGDSLVEEVVREARNPTKPFRRTRLTGKDRKTLVSVIADAFNTDELREFFSDTFDRSLDSIVRLSGNAERVALDIVDWAEQARNLDALIVALRDIRPADSDLLAVANDLGLSTVRFDGGQLSRFSETMGDFHDADSFVGKLGDVESRVCRIEVELDEKTQAYGTGFLVGPNLLMTSSAVFRDVLDQMVPAENVRLRFDFKVRKKREIFEGVEFGLSGGDWLVADLRFKADPDAGILLVRTDGFPGDEPVGGRETGGASVRGWISMDANQQAVANSAVFILHHSQAGPLKLSWADEGVVSVDSEQFVHEVRTEAGASGAPCFDADFNLIGVHQGARGGTKYATRIDAIANRLAEQGLLDEVGSALA